MEWFGWLLKPHLQVSVLDRLIMVFELIAVGGPLILIFTWLEIGKKKV